ncbi:hypothetical protein ACFLRG_02710 [Bacteroidota bacterium]
MDKEKKSRRYERIYDQLEDLLIKSNNIDSRLATVVAVLHHKMDDFFWTGFYLLHDGKLLVGPYQGPVACMELQKDTGVCWAGIDYKNIAEIDNLIKMSYNSSNLKFKGFLTHAGNTYNTVDKEEVISIHNNNLCIMNDLKKRYKPEWPEIQISIGDTPSCSISDNFDGIDEIRPGNFVFYDLMQQNIGSCDFEDIAIVLACPVVSLDNNSNKIIILGGAIHLSKESMLNKNGEKIFGRIVRFNSNYSWESPEPDLYVNSISQEHGIINANKEFINNVQIGDIIGILPVHSCLTANLMARYTSLSGNIIDHFSSRK